MRPQMSRKFAAENTARGLWRMLDKVTNVLSGEFILDLAYRHGRSNSGTVIFLRSLLVTSIVYAAALILHSGSYSEWTWRFWMWGIDGERLRTDVAHTITWLGAIFAGVYVALYARFSAQYSYLQQAYNQLMGAAAAAAAVQEPAYSDVDDILIHWWAGFIEDAQHLHLATKRSFAVAIWFMLENPRVYKAFDQYAAGSTEGRVAPLIKALRRAIGSADLERMGASRQLMAGEPPPDDEKGPRLWIPSKPLG